MSVIHTIDLNFCGLPGAIAAYLIPHAHGAILVESGPGSTIPALQAGLRAHGLSEKDISDVLLTHIHLDHAGAAGWLARQGARIHVHEVGAPHLLDPERLLSSAARIYGAEMETLWGEFLPVPEERLSVLHDGDVIEVDGLRLRAIETPGHAYHHFAYVFQDVCFTGDIGGVRMFNTRHLRLPMPPPEFNPEVWRQSIERLKYERAQGSFRRIAPTHFGIFDDPDWHLQTAAAELDAIETWMLLNMPSDPPVEQLREKIVAWFHERAVLMGVEPETLKTYEVANPTWMAAAGIYRYWHKVRNAQ